MEVCEISRRMKNLDFDAKYEPMHFSSKELVLLGNNMNELSETLEATISELKAANNELKNDIAKKEEIDEMRKEFLSNVSHELKTPLALISGYAEGLKECINDSEESRDFYCDVIMDETDKMNRMVGKLLSLNQLEFGNDRVEMLRFDITEVIRGVVSANSLLASTNGITISFAESEPAYVWGDEFKVEEVITNYLSNAIHYAAGKKVIRVFYEKNDGKLRVCVYNSGANISEEELDKVWIKFYKVDKARTREYGGSGIGLSIVKAIMDSHHQACGVYNVEDGVVFWMELECNIS
jgi:signal transduction histidine kinase